MKWCMLLLVVLGGCSSARPGDEVIAVAPGGYAAAFEAAKDTIAAYRFDLDRVDARGGVITTLPKATSGLATPWDAEQSRLINEWEDLLNQQVRRVRVTFEAGEGPAKSIEVAKPTSMARSEPPADLRLHEGPLTARIEVIIDRRRRPGWRVETSSIRLSSFAEDPTLRERRMWPRYDTPFVQDRALAERVGRGVARRMAAEK